MSRTTALKLDDDEALPPTLMTGGGDGGGDEEDEPAMWWEGRVIIAGPRFKLGWFMHCRPKASRRRRTKSTAVQLKFEF